MAAGYGAHVLLARWMGAEGYGVYTYVLAATALLSIGAAAGVPTSVVRFIPAYRAEQKWGRLHGFLRWSVAQTLAIGVVLGVGLVGVAWYFGGDETLREAMLVGAAVVPLQALFALVAGTLCALHRAGWAHLMPTWRHGLLIAGAYLLYAHAGAVSGAQGLAATALAILVVIAIQGAHLYTMIPSAAVRARPTYEPRTWWKVSMPLLMVSGFILLINQTDVLMVGTLLSPREAGLYRAASKTAMLVVLVPGAVRTVMEPRLVELYTSEQRGSLQRLTATAVRWSFFPSVVVAGILSMAAVPILELFGPEFAAARDVLLVLVLGQVLLVGAGVAGSLLNLTGHQRRGAFIFGMAAVLNVGLNAAGILLAGTLGAAMATATTLCLLGVGLWWAGRRHIGVDASIVAALGARSHEKVSDTNELS